MVFYYLQYYYTTRLPYVFISLSLLKDIQIIADFA